MADGAGLSVAAGLGVGVWFVVLFSLMFPAERQQDVTIIIPRGSSDLSLDKEFEPNFARLFIGVNNTITWKNQDTAAHNIVADSNFEPDLGAGTNQTNKLHLDPGESFEYTFTNPGRYNYHGEPGPSTNGLIMVFPELLQKPYVNIAIEGLKGNYKAGDPVAFAVVVEGYGQDCASFRVMIESKDASQDYSYSSGWTPGCVLDTPFHDFKHHYTLGPESQDMLSPLHIDQAGTYLLTVSYKNDVTGEKGYAESEFVIG